ncbi:unnamed protein product [Discosporangium mesarthrocarpum]
MPFLDNFAHIGGIIMGFLLGLVLLVQKREDDKGELVNKKCYQVTLQGLAVVAVPAVLIVFFALLYSGNDPSSWCEWCDRISCVEFPRGDSPWWRCDECSTTGFQVCYWCAVGVLLVCYWCGVRNNKRAKKEKGQACSTSRLKEVARPPYRCFWCRCCALHPLFPQPLATHSSSNQPFLGEMTLRACPCGHM